MDYEATMTAEQKETANELIKCLGLEITVNELFGDIAEFFGKHGAPIEITRKTQSIGDLISA